MKKLYLMGLVGLLCAACSNEDVPGGEATQSSTLTGNERYMAVQLVSPDGASSRASRADYADGLEVESDVATDDIVFYFFNADGTACPIDGTNSYSHALNTQVSEDIAANDVSWTSDSRESVTKVSSAIIMLRNANVVPAKVVAVLNSTIAEQNYSLTALANAEVEAGYATNPTTGAKTKFMMSNSVYMDETSNEAIQATEITSENIYSSAKSASLNPVNIYVERVVAKVGVVAASTSTSSKDVFKLTNEEDAEGNQLYVKLLKWTTFDESEKTYALKHIDTAYNPTVAWTWNNAALYRSFWADTTPFSVEKQTLAYNDITTPVGGSETAVTTDYCYPFENTSGLSSDEGLATKVIIAAKLYSDEACETEATVCQFLGTRFTLDGLKTQIAGMLAKNIFVKTADDTYTSIDKTYIDFIADDYYARPQLISSKGDEAVTYYNAAHTALTDDDIDLFLTTIPKAKIWNGGMCYYYTYITHLNNERAVIRNHWYQLTVNTIEGLGTPVYDPTTNSPFDPTRPEDDEWVLGAKINIQAWRIVGQSVGLTSTLTTDDENESQWTNDQEAETQNQTYGDSNQGGNGK